MSYYYYPLCSKDFTFENIFASESISPYIFYSKRGFGIDYFYKIPKVHHEKAITLFEEPPAFETGSNNSNIIKFILAINKGSLDQTEIISIDNGIFGYKKTIYLDKVNFAILFFSETDKKVACLRSETSLPTKGLGKYSNNFKLINESDCRKTDFSNIEQFKIDNERLGEALFHDRLYNTFKGFVYGIAAGVLREKSREEVRIKRSFQEIANCFAELRNRKENEQKGLDTRYSKTFGTGQGQVKIFYDKLINAIITSQNLFYDLFAPQIITEEEIAKYLFSIKEQRLKTLEEALRYVSYRILDDELLGTNGFQQIKTSYLTETGKMDPSVYYENLRALAEKSLKGLATTNWNSNRKGNLNIVDDFKESLHELSKFADQNLLPKREAKRIDFEAIKFNPETITIAIDPGFGGLKDHELEEYQMIVNIILQIPKAGKGHAKKEQILTIVEETGNKTSKANGGKQTRLYRYLNNEINDYSIENASSIVMKNFVAFIFNVDSLENLENYTEIKEIDKKWISNSFWCLFNGFANTSGNFLKHIFDNKSERLQNEIDIYLKKGFPNKLIGLSRLEEDNISEPEPLEHENGHEKKVDVAVRFQEFYNKYIKGKLDIEFEKFVSIFQKKNAEEILKALKSQHKVLKKDGKKLLEMFNEYISSGTLF